MRKFGGILLTFCVLSANAQIKVLFLGNSFTYMYDIPALFENMADNAGISVLVEEYTQPGIAVGDWTGFNGHTTDAAAQAKINSQDWDFVIVQDNLGGWVYEYIPSVIGNSNVDLYNQIKANNSCTEIVYFAGWGPVGGVPGATSSGIDNTINCIERIHDNIVYFNDASGANEIVCPLGKSWIESMQQMPGVNLYYSDQVHPSLEGSYLAAATLFGSVFKVDVNTLTYNGGVSSSTASLFRSIAWDMITDNALFIETNLDDHTPLITWNGTNLITSGYSTYQWYLNGNPISGASASAYNPTTNGTYKVVGFNSSCDFESMEYELNTISVDEIGEKISFEMYPNPASDVVIVSLNESSDVIIYNSIGAVIYTNQLTNALSEIDVSQFENGLYTVIVQTHAGSSCAKQLVIAR